MSDLFKYDVRVRGRMIEKGLVTEAEIAERVGKLADVAAHAVPIELPQPAIGGGAPTTLAPASDTRPANDDEDEVS
ncbi:MAG: hypothetical protein IT376_06395 [Polyangiaceae bacterium]|nr:hypothetical protein [Polyangiaceae bacterium]